MADKYKETDKMSDLICDDYRLLQVISRFELPLGFGEKTVREVCDENHVNCSTFLAVVNFTKYGDIIADEWVDKISISSLTNYLHKSHSYYLDFLLPSIRRKLLDAIDCSSHNEVAFLILRFFDAYVSEVRRHLERENEMVFPYIDQLINGKIDEGISQSMSMLHKEPVEQKLRELKNIIIKYYTARGNANLLNIALYDLFMTEEDLYMHYRLEESLFLPAIHYLEARKREDENDTENTKEGEESDNDESDVLSEREKDIIIGVVKGLTNKEIADHLYISINTVTTHRRNIARKLDIHSPAGLTIYAIANNLVNFSELCQSDDENRRL
jgi:regulator of cell morphogenesis and NO signaling